jgi:hypothetical protein
MLFVCKYAKHRHLIEGGSQKQGFDADGHIVRIETSAAFWAEFQLGGLDPHDAELAVQEFTRRNSNDPFGAIPVGNDGSINPIEAAEDLETHSGHEGYAVRQRISRFDTEDGRMCPKRWQDRAEEVLMESMEIKIGDIIRLDVLTLVPPWPTYDTMEAEEIVPFALTGGYDLDWVLRYEKATQKRPAVGKPLKRALDERRARAVEQAALTVSA